MNFIYKYIFINYTFNSLNISINQAYRNTQNNIKRVEKPDSYVNNLLSTEGIFILTK